MVSVQDSQDHILLFFQGCSPEKRGSFFRMTIKAIITKKVLFETFD